MSRRKRWQPPHPDPAKKRTWEEPRCAWVSCREERLTFFPVCYEHAQLIASVMNGPADGTKEALISTAIFNEQFLKRERQIREVEQLHATRGSKPGWIYYVLTDGKIKIGYSTNITRRLRAYPPGSEVLAVHPGTPDLEKQIHRDFDAHRVAGREWFRPDPEILDHCERVVAEHGDPQRFAPKVRDPHASKQVTSVRGWSGRKTA